MARLYKLTDERHQTYGQTQWGPGVTHEGTGQGGLCGPGWIHAYEDPLLALFLNPIHAGFTRPVLWEAEGEIDRRDHGLKVGCKKLTTLRIIPLPEISIEQWVRFAILCARRVETNPTWRAWADAWLDGSDRTAAAAEVVAAAAAAAAEAVEGTEAAAAAVAGAVAAEAAAAAGAGAVAEAAAVQAAEAAAAAVEAAAVQAAEAAEAGADIDLIARAREAVNG